MDCSGVIVEDGENETSSPPDGSSSPLMERNPSPPPESADGDEGVEADAIGDTVYSKHWLFSTLTHLIQMVTKSTEEPSEGQTQLSDDEEEDLCKLWDMAMDKDVADLLQEFKAADIFLGVISKSRCPRLTEICVGILGNMACFPDTCLPLSQNDDLCAVLLLLLGDADPPTLLETSRLVLTCLSHKDTASLWLRRIQEQASVRGSLLFIMCSSTNADLLEKVGELVDQLFDLDEELMKDWVTAQRGEESPDGRVDGGHLDLASCLLEAAKQLRSESPSGLEVYLHAIHLLTTVEEGAQSLASTDGAGPALWDFVRTVVCEDLCQAGDLPVLLQEQKGLLVQAFAVLQALCRSQDHWSRKKDTSLPLVGTVLRVIQHLQQTGPPSRDHPADEQLQALDEITAELLADLCLQIPKDSVADLVKGGHLTDKTCLTAASSLLPNFKDSFQHLQSMLSEADPRMADELRRRLPL